MYNNEYHQTHIISFPGHSIPCEREYLLLNASYHVDECEYKNV